MRFDPLSLQRALPAAEQIEGGEGDSPSGPGSRPPMSFLVKPKETERPTAWPHMARKLGGWPPLDYSQQQSNNQLTSLSTVATAKKVATGTNAGPPGSQAEAPRRPTAPPLASDARIRQAYLLVSQKFAVRGVRNREELAAALPRRLARLDSETLIMFGVPRSHAPRPACNLPTRGKL
jgi:hypothetical protein